MIRIKNIFGILLLMLLFSCWQNNNKKKSKKKAISCEEIIAKYSEEYNIFNGDWSNEDYILKADTTKNLLMCNYFQLDLQSAKKEYEKEGVLIITEVPCLLKLKGKDRDIKKILNSIKIHFKTGFYSLDKKILFKPKRYYHYDGHGQNISYLIEGELIKVF